MPPQAIKKSAKEFFDTGSAPQNTRITRISQSGASPRVIASNPYAKDSIAKISKLIIPLVILRVGLDAPASRPLTL
jgi:hypothetical protein